MKIISIHVENFGKLHDVDIDFNDGLNEYAKENGHGKSTLSFFIKAMLYGLQNDGKKDLANERKRFAPWQGGAFGGKMVIEVSGVEYVINRTFGAKSNEDTFELRDSIKNLISNDYSEKIGEEIFNINAESFMRTVFISQNDTSNFHATDDVNAKIGNITDAIDLNKFTEADEILKKAISQTSTRKTSDLYPIREEITNLKKNINDGIGTENTLAEIEERLIDLKEQIAEGNKIQSDISKKKTRQANISRKLELKKQYSELLAEREEKLATLDNAKSKFPKEIPNEEVINEWENALINLSNENAVKKSHDMNMAERDLLKDLSFLFIDSVPSDSEIDEYVSKSQKLQELRLEESKRSLSQDEINDLNFYKQVFKSQDEAREKVEGAISDWNECKYIITDNERLREELESEKNIKDNKGTKSTILVAGILSIALSGLLFSLKLLYPAVALALAGIILLVSCFFVKNKRNEGHIKELYEKLSDNEERIKEVTEKVKQLFYKFDYDFSIDTASLTLTEIQRKVFHFDTLSEKESNFRQNVNSEDMEALAGDIFKFLSGFSIKCLEEDASLKLSELKIKVNQYAALSLRAKELDNATKKINEIDTEVRNSMSSYGIILKMNLEESLSIVKEDFDAFINAKKFLQDVEKRISDFENKNDMEELSKDIPKEDLVSMEDLNAMEQENQDRLEELRSAFNINMKNHDVYEELLDKLEEDKERLIVLQDKEKEISTLHDRLEITRELLTKAKENLTAKYMGPLLSGFQKAYSSISGESANNYLIDANLNVTKEEQGLQRKIETLSGGYQDLVGLCMRIAMTEAMYKDEKPMLILDDPFAFLDKSKTEKGKELLKELAKDYQILHLTCD